MARERLELKVTKETYDFFKTRKEKTGETFSEIVEKLILQQQIHSEDFMNQLAELIFEKFKPSLVQLRTIGNETNVVARTNKEILNYMLLADNYMKEFETNGKDKEHLATINAHAKVRSEINYQRLISLENQRLKSERNQREDAK
ncbi:hypothetical protein [Turicibacter bilis]|uniref:hypothetical protein n=1 Tax=Turicibacter bilis TaxID=2735723 RepID=UPI001BB04BA8|nr:hypothetical protein [Turicibacter bilis]MBS3198968.1 hypothetical protein [Turicibacter bilis]